MEEESQRKYTWERYTTGFARKLLEKYGYVEGLGLGIRGDGILHPLEPNIKPDRIGIHAIDELHKIKSFSETTRQWNRTTEQEVLQDEQNLVLITEQVRKQEEHLSQAEVKTAEPREEEWRQIVELIANIQSRLSDFETSKGFQHHRQSPLEPKNFSVSPAEQIHQLCVIKELIEDCIERFQEEDRDLFHFVSSFVDQLLEEFKEYYEQLDLATFIFLLVYNGLLEDLSTWDFSLSQLKSHQSFYLASFARWRNFLLPKVSFKTHHLWSQVTGRLLDKIKNFLILEWNPLEHNSFVIDTVRNWQKLLPIENIVDETVPTFLMKEVDRWQPDAAVHSPLTSILGAWIPFVDASHMETVHLQVYNKICAALERNWNFNDLSVLGLLLEWNLILPSFLLEKVLAAYLLPQLSEWLQNFYINPRDQQQITEFWLVLQWYPVFSTTSQLQQTYVQLLERHFFTRWLNTLYNWLLSSDYSYLECMQWYLGWKRMFSTELFGLVFQQFSHALHLMQLSLVKADVQLS